MVHFHSYFWVENLLAYQMAAPLMREGSIPLIDPCNSRRKKHWTKILMWYGTSPIKKVEMAIARFSEAESPDLIIALDAAFTVPARAYAAAEARFFQQVEDDNKLEHLVNQRIHSSILFIGLPGTFTGKYLRYLSSLVSVPWGVVTALDLPGLTFVIAKLLAGKADAEGNWASVDVPNNKIQQFSTKGWPGRAKFLTPELVYGLFYERNWHTLAIHAHGEGGHGNLNSVVLCGLVGKEEHSLTGELIDGCRFVDNHRHCKRVHDPHKYILSFSELRVRRLCFLSCNSFTVAGDLYPSDVSCILASAEGYPMAVLTSDRPMSFEPWVPHIILGLLGQKVGLGAVQQFMNDQQMRWSACQPYILFGDPCGSNPQYRVFGIDGSLLTSTDIAILPLQLESWASSGIIGLETSCTAVKLVRGLSHVAVILPPDIRQMELKLVDRTAQWEKQLRWFNEIGRRVRNGSRLERAIRWFYRSQLEASPDFRSKIVDLAKIRERIEEMVHAGLRECETVRLQGVWTEVLEQRKIPCEMYVGLWDRYFAKLIEEHLFSGSFEQIFTDSLTLTCGINGTFCDYCGSSLTILRGQSSSERQWEQLSSFCPTCGFREAWRVDGVRLEVKLPKFLTPNIEAEIRVQFLSDRVKVNSRNLPGLLVGEFKDKGRGQVFFRLFQQLSCNSFTCKVSVPADICADLHTLRLAWVQGLDVTFQRWRCPAIRTVVE